MSNAIFLKNNIVEFGSDDKEKSEKNTWCCYEICKDEIIHIAEKKGIEVDKIDFDDVIRYVKQKFKKRYKIAAGIGAIAAYRAYRNRKKEQEGRKK